MEKEENLYAKNCIRTFTGKYIDPFDPDPAAICIEDIAHSLSMQCRFGGHLPIFHSVAQHCYLCSLQSEDEYKFEALMHDASEAYLLDMPKPIKDRLPEYKRIEANLMYIIAEKFGFRYPMSHYVHEIDEDILKLEWEYCMLRKSQFSWSRQRSEQEFLDRFKNLTKINACKIR